MLLTSVGKCMQERKVAVLLYGFPPRRGGHGHSRPPERAQVAGELLEELQAAGLRPGAGQPGRAISGEAIINALRMQEDQRSISAGAAGIEKA